MRKERAHKGKKEGVICKRESAADSVDTTAGEADQWAKSVLRYGIKHQKSKLYLGQ